MKKHLLWLAALSLSMAACTNEPTSDLPGGGNNDGTTEPTTAELIQLSADQTRVLFPGAEEEGNGGWLEAPDHLNPGQGSEVNVEHIYSATGIAFNGTTVYVSWHSNRLQDVDNNEEEDHRHGTNVGEDESEPSIDNAKEWGGMIDVISFAGEQPVLVSSYWQPEHKYNHVLYADNNLYLASTSWFVGAALHKVPVTGSGLETTESERFNLVGNSANCVVKVDGKLVTVSGRSEGGVNWFDEEEIAAAFDPEDVENKNVYNLTEAYVNESTENFGGKHIYVDGETVYVLRNPSAPVIESYTSEGVASTINLPADYKLTPVDGKNVLTGDDKYLYACCGQYGLAVYDKEAAEWVATSHKNTADNKNATLAQKYYAANGVDVDENYIYVANGSGLVIFEKLNEAQNNLNVNGGLKVVKNAQFNGTLSFDGFEELGNEKTQDGLVKESSNFVKLYTNGDKHYAFVAYGMYGLRIYDLSELYPVENEVVPEE